MDAWRASPFTRGRKYRVLESFQALRDAFAKDEVLTYESEGYSLYDGMAGYFFRDSSNKIRTFDVSDEVKDHIGLARERFVELPGLVSVK
jgi:hypothetical protein